MQVKSFTLKTELRLLLTIGLLLAIGYVISLIFPAIKVSVNEIERIKNTSNFSEQVRFYRELIDRVGPEKAQEELYKSGLPFTGQTHFLNHTVGDYLFEKYGPAGLIYCKGYFLSACEHQLILRAVGVKGDSVIPKIVEKCRESDQAVFSQCAHGIGHGLLAMVGYKNLPAALEQCDKLGEKIEDFPLFNCYDGVFMENIWGAHEGEPSADRWVKDSDPFYPCDDPIFVEREDYQLGCWSNQPALAYQLLRGDIKGVGDLCLRVEDSANQKMCFEGLARQINPITSGSVDAVFKICGLMPSSWIDSCIITNAYAYFGVGDREIPFAICNRMAEKNKGQCYQGLIGSIKYHGKDAGSFCAKIEDSSWRERCLGN